MSNDSSHRNPSHRVVRAEELAEEVAFNWDDLLDAARTYRAVASSLAAARNPVRAMATAAAAMATREDLLQAAQTFFYGTDAGRLARLREAEGDPPPFDEDAALVALQLCFALLDDDTTTKEAVSNGLKGVVVALVSGWVNDERLRAAEAEQGASS